MSSSPMFRVTGPLLHTCVPESERLIGDAAKNQVARNPENTVFDAKRLIGRKFNDSVVQADIKLWPFKVECGTGDKPMIEVHYMGEDKKFHPEEISSMILIKMKETAEASGNLFSRIPCTPR